MAYTQEDHLAPLLDRLGLDRSNWLKTVRKFGRMFKQAAGRASSLARAAPRCSRWHDLTGSNPVPDQAGEPLRQSSITSRPGGSDNRNVLPNGLLSTRGSRITTIP